MQRNFRFLISSNIHLGHEEKDAVRGKDSSQGFDEVVCLAKQQQVDFLLLCGNLFNDVNPSTQSHFSCISTIRKYVLRQMSERGSQLQVSLNGKEYATNIADQRQSVAFPIFAIHGNHDYPTAGKISSYDLLQANSYINYFGKDPNPIIIKPLLITRPGSPTCIALYGLGYIKEQILKELLQGRIVQFEKPQQALKNTHGVFVLHQSKGSLQQFFKFPQWIKLVIWGHEIEPIQNLQKEEEIYTCQPGSTVITSYIHSDSTKKQCLLIEVTPKGAYNLISLPLDLSYRPMKCLSYEYAALKANRGDDFELFTYLREEIEHALQEFEKPYAKKKPIIRIKVDITGLTRIKGVKQFQKSFAARVANGKKILQLWTKRVPKEGQSEELNMRENKPFTFKSMMEQLQPNFKSELVKMRVSLTQEALEQKESLNLEKIMDLKCQEAQEVDMQPFKKEGQQMQQVMKEKDDAYKCALKYYKDRVGYHLTTGKYDALFYSNCATDADFLALKDAQYSEDHLKIIIKPMEESGLPLHQQHQESVEVGERLDSEDREELEEKKEYNETANKLRYLQAQQNTKVEVPRRKKPATTSIIPKKLPKKQKAIKQINFFKDEKESM